jgi:hypothetical protein
MLWGLLVFLVLPTGATILNSALGLTMENNYGSVGRVAHIIYYLLWGSLIPIFWRQFHKALDGAS